MKRSDKYNELRGSIIDSDYVNKNYLVWDCAYCFVNHIDVIIDGFKMFLD